MNRRSTRGHRHSSAFPKRDTLLNPSVTTPSQVSSEFQAYKHVEIIGPGEYARAGTPLEARLSFPPTVPPFASPCAAP